MELLRAWESQVEHGAKRAAVCSRPPSEVGVGIVLDVVAVVRDFGEERGRK